MKNSLPTSQIGEFIRVAEHHISAHEFDLAMDQLEKARRIEPGNFYIDAIVPVKNLREFIASHPK